MTNTPKNFRPVVLIIRDGWGINLRSEGNAVFAADTPCTDHLLSRYPVTQLQCCGEAVGLPEGYQGSSEVGHLNIGAGRVVIQELKRIDDGLTSGEIFDSDKWRNLIKNWKANNSTFHLMGLLQDEGVHAHQEHLFKIMRRARKENPGGKIIVHPFLDGRDTPPRSTLEYLAALAPVLKETNASIGTFMGRYYGMDRSKNYALTSEAYHCIVSAKGRAATNITDAIKTSYANDKTPDATEMVDEYIPCHVMAGYTGVKDGDCVMHTNYRQDRAIQLTQAFWSDNYPGQRDLRPNITYLGFTRYWDEFPDYLLGVMGEDGAMDNLLGQVIANAGLKQLRIAETQKFRHVTSFFNGKSTKPFANEDQFDVPSRFDPATFASHPEMEAFNVTDELLKRLENNPYHFIAVNYANCDMVGHTGDLAAAQKAVEIVDQCLAKLLPRLFALNARILITADHGNAEQMIDYASGINKTSHTLSPVHCLYVADDAPGTQLLPLGKLSDIAPTVLHLLGLPIPAEMTAQNLIVAPPPWN